MIIGGEDLTLRVIHRMIKAGISAVKAAEMMNVSEEAIYHRGKPERELLKSKCRRISLSAVEQMERLIREGFPADVVAFAAGIPLDRLISFLRYCGDDDRE